MFGIRRLNKLEVLLENAFDSAKELPLSDKDIFQYGKDDDHKRPLSTILYAGTRSTGTSCQGKASAGYTTLCILACHDYSDLLDKLRSLATTWVTRLLILR